MAVGLLVPLLGEAGAVLFVAGAVATAKYAVVIYGLYNGIRARNKAKRDADNAIQDRTSSLGGTDMPRSVVYGERVVDGRIVYAVEPTDDQPGVPAGQEPKVYIVKALEPDHEVERIIDLQFDGRSVGPFIGDPNNSTTGVYVAPGSFYYLQRTGLATHQGVVSPNGIIDVPGVAITKVATLALSGSSFTPGSNSVGGDFDSGDVYQQQASPNYIVSLGQVLLGQESIGLSYNLTYEFAVNRPLVRAWFYRGTETQQACAKVTEVSKGEWNSKCMLIGTPYIVVEIWPDLDKFAGGVPYITATVRGKRALLVTGGSAYTDNPCDHIHDYLRTEIGVRSDEIDMALLAAADAACDELVPIGPGFTEPRYRCHTVLSTADRLIDNFRLLLGSMAGTAIYTDKFDIRAGVAQAPELTSLNESDLSSGPMEVVPFTPMEESFNAVRGRALLKTLQSGPFGKVTPGGIALGDAVYTYALTDYRPYKSDFYVGQDNGQVNWEDIDQPCVTSGFQVQRIAKLLLHLNRNGLMFSAEWNMSTARYSPGQVVAVNVVPLGFTAKPFRFMRRKTDTERNVIQWTMREEPAAVYSYSYLEGRDPDPAPNTTLERVDVVEAVKNIRVFSTPYEAEYADDGSVRPIARILWDKAASYGVRHGGRVEVQWKFGRHVEFQKELLPGDAVSLEVPIARSIEMAGQIRFINAVQFKGEFKTFDHLASDTPTQYLPGNLLMNAGFEFFSQTQRPDAAYPSELWYIPYWSSIPRGSSPNGGLVVEGGPVRVVPIVSVAPIGVAYTGFAQWVDKQASVHLEQSMVSDNVAIVGGSRLALFASGYSRFGRLRIGVIFERDGQFISRDFSVYAEKSPPNAPGTRAEDYRRAELIIDVPATATHCRMYLNDSRPSGFPDAFYTVVHWFRPFIGYASPGQVTLPPWSK